MMLLLSILSPLIPLITGWHRKNSILWQYAVAELLADLCISSFKHLLHWNFYWIGNLYLPFEFVLLNCYYKNRVFGNKKTLFFVLIATSMVVYLLHTTFLSHNWQTFNYIASSVSNFYFIALSIIGFYFFLKEQKVLFFERSTFFWANTAILVYASGSFFIFLLRNTIQAADPKAMSTIWSHVFLSLNILKNILLGIALLKKEGS